MTLLETPLRARSGRGAVPCEMLTSNLIRRHGKSRRQERKHMTRLKTRFLAAGFAGALAVASVGSAFATSDNANQNACFGQGRATYATTSEPGAVGAAASERKGDNAAQNAAYRDAC